MIQGILLAAGNGMRFGGQKLLAPLPSGTPVAVAAARNLLAALPRSIAVIQPNDRELARRLVAEGMAIVEYRGKEEGMGFSLACAVSATPDAGGWAIALADMPFIPPAVIRQVVSLIEAGAALAAPQYRGRRGHPVVFGPTFREELQTLAGDTGARGVITAHSHRLHAQPVGESGVLQDIDSPDDLAPIPPVP